MDLTTLHAIGSGLRATPASARVALVFAVVTGLMCSAGCQSCDEDEVVVGKGKADASVHNDGGQFGDGGGLGDAGTSDADTSDGANADGGLGDADGTADTVSNNGDGAGDSDAADDGDTADSATGPAPCDANGDCPTKQLCGLFYNNVKSLDGDPRNGGGVKAPAWANLCVDRPTVGAPEGQACDPFAGDPDTTLPPCVNQSACMQGLCTALCTTDVDCPSGARCGVTEAPVELDDGGIKRTLWLAVDICLPMPGPGGECGRDADCPAGAQCRPFTHRDAKGAIRAYGRCVMAEAGKAKLGDGCGAAAVATGVGKLCGSTQCLYAQGAVAGVCTAPCASQSDCPSSLSWNGTSFPTACASLFLHHGDNASPKPAAAAQAMLDDVYWPHCVLVNQNSTLKDCAASRTCGGTEACLPFAIAWGPDLAAKVEYRCVEQVTKGLPGGPTKDDGAACDPAQTEHGCKGGLCERDGKGGGLCSRVCLADAGCGGGLKCKQVQRIPRADLTKAAVVELCLP